MTQAQQQLYTHVAQPKAVSQRKPKYREQDEEQSGVVTNMMYDRRIVRGNTYAARILPADVGMGVTGKSQASTARQTGTIGVHRTKPRTPEPVEGRRHADIQTDAYLEELTDIVPEADNATQTDTFLDRPPTPLFVPQKTGADAATQIANGDLFDFDFEVEPVLEVLVGKVLEQGLMEVLEEEELAAMRSHQEYFEQIRNAELVATQRMEAAEARKMEEKQRRVVQERERLAREKVVREKVAASTFARGFLSGIVSSAFDKLVDAGVFYDPVEHEVETVFMPWLKQQAAAYLEQGVIARQVVKRLVKAAADKVQATREAGCAAVEQERKVRLAWARKQAQVAHQLADLASGRANELGSFLLKELEPALVPRERVEEEREAIASARAAESEAAHEAAKAAAGEAARAAAEAAAAARSEALETARAKAAEDAGEEGLPEDWAPADGEIPDEVDIEAAVAKAIDSVKVEEQAEVNDDDVLMSLLDKGELSKDVIMKAMAVDELGAAAWYRMHGDVHAGV